MATLGNDLPFCIEFCDQDEYNSFTRRGDPVLHIELKQVARALVIAPLSANTLAKIVNGLSDNLLTCVFRAWPYHKQSSGAWEIAKPVVVAPAMNTNMYEHPITEKQLATLEKELKVKVLPTVEKLLMCNQIGKGAMADISTILDAIKDLKPVITYI